MLLVMGLQSMVKAPVLAVWAVCKIAGKNGAVDADDGGMAVGALLADRRRLHRAGAAAVSRRMQALTDDLNRVTRENLTGLRVVRAYNAEGVSGERSSTAPTTR